MIKILCNHCGKETTYANKLDEDELFLDGSGFVGMGSHLCDDCYELRIQKLIDFDREFLKIGRDNND